MCQFFSCVSDGKGKVLYFDATLREKIKKGEIRYNPDSHTSIADYFGYKGKKEDSLNKYEYNPLTGKFVIDQINTTDDSKKVEQFCLKLNFQTVVPELIIQPIFYPFKYKKRKRVCQIDIELLKKWDSVRNSVGDSVWDSVWDSVGYSVWDSVGDIAWDSVRNSVWDSVWDSVGDSTWDSVRNSVWDSVVAYASSFFNLSKWKYFKYKKGVNPFKPCVDLWHRGIVPSFDGKTWRLHGYEGKILKEITEQELRG